MTALHDLRHGIALLLRRAGGSALIVLVLALGIGGNTAVFVLLKAAFVDPLPYADADRLVTIRYCIPDQRIQGGVNLLNPTVSQYLEIRKRSRALEEIALLNHRDFQLIGMDEPERVVAARVSASFFSLLGARTALGRTFFAEENIPGRNLVVIVSDSFWRVRMGADAGAVGQRLRLNGEPYVVVGVLQRDFTFDYPSLGAPEPADIYIPFPLDDAPDLGVTGGQSAIPEQARVIARIRNGTGDAAVADELLRIAGSLYPVEHRSPDLAGERSFRAQPLREAIISNSQSLLWLLTAGAGLLLLIACANTSELLLARSLRRGQEIAIRTALGATRGRLIQQFLMEGLVLAACGGGIGLLISYWIVRLLVRFLPVRSPMLESAHLDARVLAVTFGLSVICAVIFSIGPAVKDSARAPRGQLNDRVIIGRGNRWRHLMIAINASLSVFLVCGAGVIVQNLWSLISTPAGFDPNNVLVMQLRLPPRDRTGPVIQEYLQRIGTIPGVDAVAAGTVIPLRPGNAGFNRIVGEPREALARRRATWTYFVSPDYFRTLGIPLIAGRTFYNSDTTERPLVAVVNQEFARSHGIESNPIGRQIDDGPSGLITIVGVVGNVRVRGMQTLSEPQLYMAYLQFYQQNLHLLVRSPLQKSELIARVKTAIRSAYPQQPVFNVMTMRELFWNSIAAARFNALSVGAFAGFALVMAAIGMYSLISYLVSQRTNEIALRIALGASPSAIVRAVFATTTAWVATGLTAGLAAGLAATNAIGSLSNSVNLPSATMYIVVLLVFLVVALAAAWLPVWRAIRVDPVIALRCE